ncbi:MAG: hypothetical protein H0T91_10555 [Propionibacteriaceae bacterium]|nr:hypothetical protein [Propionibacteriaceae bacterium]
MTDSGNGLGRSERHYQALGKLAVAAGRLEYVAYDIARSMGGRNVELETVATALKAARKQALREMPPWATTSPEDLVAWIEQVLDRLQQGQRLQHAAVLQEVEQQGAVVPIAVEPRDDAHFDIEPNRISAQADIEQIDNLTASIQASEVEGHSLLLGLWFLVRAGVFARHPGLAGESTNQVVVVWDTEGQRWPSQPSNQELSDWYDTLEATAPPDWEYWPDDAPPVPH